MFGTATTIPNLSLDNSKQIQRCLRDAKGLPDQGLVVVLGDAIPFRAVPLYTLFVAVVVRYATVHAAALALVHLAAASWTLGYLRRVRPGNDDLTPYMSFSHATASSSSQARPMPVCLH